MAKLTDETRASLRRRSRLVNLGRDAEFSQGFINVPPFRGSTVLYPDVATLKGRAQRFTYGTRGTPSTEVLSSAWTDLTGAAGTVLLPSGLAAIVVALMTALSAGDHLLMTNSVYSPARAFANKTLRRMGIETTYYDPTIGAGIAALIRPNTRVVFTESPGSETLEVQDIPAIAEAAHGAGACVIMDNTWATPLFFPPHAHGVDMAIEAGTKYLSGHADLLLGLVSANAEWFERLARLRPSDGHSRRPGGRLSRAARPAHDGASAARGRASGACARPMARRPPGGPSRHPPRFARSSRA